MRFPAEGHLHGWSLADKATEGNPYLMHLPLLLIFVFPCLVVGILVGLNLAVKPYYASGATMYALPPKDVCVAGLSLTKLLKVSLKPCSLFPPLYLFLLLCLVHGLAFAVMPYYAPGASIVRFPATAICMAAL